MADLMTLQAHLAGYGSLALGYSGGVDSSVLAVAARAALGPERFCVGQFGIAVMRVDEFGNLLDIIRESCGLLDFNDVADEARRFLSLPRSDPDPTPKPAPSPVQTGSPEAARRDQSA